jgi:hypothetical protein
MNSGNDFELEQSSPTQARSNGQSAGVRATSNEKPGLVHSALEMGTEAIERYASNKKARLADAIVDLTAGVRRSGRRFEGEQEWLAEAIDKGAGRVRDFAEELRDTDVRDILDQVSSFARRRPKLVVVSAVAAGAIAIGLMRRALAANMSPRTARAA